MAVFLNPVPACSGVISACTNVRYFLTNIRPTFQSEQASDHKSSTSRCTSNYISHSDGGGACPDCPDEVVLKVFSIR